MRELDTDLVDAQETRRVLDRLYGYEISPVLWRKVARGLSAGRVQSVATRLVVERERERMAFISAGYWDIKGTFATSNGESFAAKLSAVDGARVASGRDFDDRGQLRTARTKLAHLDQASAESLVANLANTDFAVTSVEDKPYTRRPAAPFTTSTLQQEASRKLRWSSKLTMQIAQRLYENGYITYMRTDSVFLSNEAVTAARKQATELYGAESVPDKPRVYKAKSDAAQEHRRLPDGRRQGFHRHHQARRHRQRLPCGRILRLRHRDHLPRLPVRLRRGQGPGALGERGVRERRSPPAAAGYRPAAGRRRADRAGPRNHPAGPLHRGLDRGRAGKARDRPPVDLRADHLHHHGPRLRHQARRRPGPELDRCSTSARTTPRA